MKPMHFKLYHNPEDKTLTMPSSSLPCGGGGANLPHRQRIFYGGMILTEYHEFSHIM